MRLVADPEAAEFVRARGGQLFLTMTKGCCSGVRWLETSTEQKGRRFEHVLSEAGLDLYTPAGMPLPDELELRLRRFPRRIEAYWNGCAWVL